MFISFNVSKVLDPFEKYDKKFYPIATNDLRGTRGDYIFNALVEFPKDCKRASAELYIYKGQLKIKNVMPLDIKEK